MSSESTSNIKHGLSSYLESQVDVVAAVRAATMDRHRTVDRCMPLSLADPKLADYVAHLRIMREWLVPLERWLDTAGLQLISRLPRIAHIPLIDADLAEAGVPPEPIAGGAVARDWVADAKIAYQWGARYVIEGSRLGAAAMYRRLSQSLHPHRLRYLQGDGTADRWPRFLRELRAHVQTPEAIRDACEGACASFDALIAVCTARVKS